MTTIFDVQESVVSFKKNSGLGDGFYAGDGSRWIKCADFEAASCSGCRYIFFVKGNTVTLYN